MFEQAFRGSLGVFISDKQEAYRLWTVLQTAYSSKNRHYHNLLHLENLLKELEPLKETISNWNLTILCIGYHDLVYNSKRSDNEEKSAEAFVADLRQHMDVASIEQGRTIILATKGHAKTQDTDTDLFTDADLSILGASPESYQLYSRQIRSEYSIYPDFLYRKGRRQVLQHFLDMDAIYKTSYFREKYEKAARLNLTNELGSL
jgi:predicted metal-dependent HD superfamily phosphohydrolase